MTTKTTNPARKDATARKVLATVLRIGGKFWAVSNAARRIVVNLLFIVFVLFIIGLAFVGDEPEFADKTALVVAPKGILVEELKGFDPQSLVDGGGPPETLLRDLIETIETARDRTRPHETTSASPSWCSISVTFSAAV